MGHRPKKTEGGFTVVEMVIIAAVIAILALLGLPALEKMIVRSKLEGTARQAAALLHQARSVAMRRSVSTSVAKQTVQKDGRDHDRLVVFADPDGNATPPAADGPSIATFWIPSNITLFEVLDQEDQETDRATFLSDGTIRAAVRFHFQDADTDADGEGQNRLETSVSGIASARIQILKYNRIHDMYLKHHPAPAPEDLRWRWY